MSLAFYTWMTATKFRSMLGWYQSTLSDRTEYHRGGKEEGPVVHGVMGCGQKKLSVSVAVPPAPIRVPSQRPLAPSVASVTSVANVIM